jgi:hypothetical protein
MTQIWRQQQAPAEMLVDQMAAGEPVGKKTEQ